MTASKAGTPTASRSVRLRYRDVLREPEAKQLLAGTLVGRLPNGMAPLAIVLAGAHTFGAATGAALAALYLLASAAGGPLIGRQADRHGQTAVFAVSGIASCAGLLAASTGSNQLWQITAAVAVAGGTKPPLEAGLRSLWGMGPGSVMPTRDHQRTALALDAASQELIYIAGPVMVAGIALAASPSAALLVTAAFGIAGTALVITTPPSRSWTPVDDRLGDWLGPVRSPQLRTLYVTMACIGVPIGAITPLAITAATRYHAPWLVGGLPAVLSAGAVLGGLAYGARSWPGTTPQQLIALAALFSAGWLAVIVTGGPATVFAATASTGSLMAPLLAVAFVTTGALAPRGTVTEAQALLVAALDVGCALGTAAAGVLHPLFLPAATTAGALILLTARRPLAQADDRAPHVPARPVPPLEAIT
ncbi:MFS transporter [Streptomyces sp. NBC_01571]|uniref:MFS transporter n=1 Tax=Streptomyces sp. NBC_01571 TaxID=2975883 RepID=UPI00224FA43A|nr:MFS transporter [Streptomyces sp. NBC_01571]MCX4580995.1 MFS transporter [Streptomyces sp. NBC_01571]